MPTTNQTNSEFREIAITDADGALLGVTVNQLDVANVANITIPGGTSGQVLAATGTGNLQWASTPASNLAESGGIEIPAQTTAGINGVWTDLTSAQFTLPSAGTWQITYNVGFSNTTNNWLGFALFTGANVIVASSSSQTTNTPTAWQRLNNTVLITVTGSTVIKLRGINYGGSQIKITNGEPNGTVTTAAGNSNIVWQKVAGFIPATGATTSYLSLSGSTTLPVTTTIAAGTDFKPIQQVGAGIPYNGTTGVITLTAGTTYEFILTITQAYGEAASTTDNGDINIAICDSTTLAVIPGGDCRVIGTQFTGRGLARSGTTSIIYTPITNQTVKIRSTYVSNSTSTAILCTVKQIGSTNTAGFTGNLGNQWSISNSYQSGTIVVKDGFLYQANSFIAAGTAFVTGTTGATWALMNIQQAEWGETVIPYTLVGVSGTSATVDVISFTLPSAGVWEVQYDVRTAVGSTARFISPYITDNNNVEIPNTRVLSNYIANPNTLDLQGTSTMTVRITTSGQATYKMKAYSSAGGAVVTDGNGVSKLTWKKISGFLPLQPQTYTSPIVVQGTTSNPSKGTTAIDYMTVTDDGSGWCDLVLSYRQSSAGTAGSGDYLFVLPGGLEFDLQYYQPRAVAGDPGQEMGCFIPGSNGMVGIPNLIMTAFATVWDANRFRLNMGAEAIWSTNGSIRNPIGSGFFALSQTTTTYQMAFKFKRQL